jgi:hypothetical protein
VLVAQTQYPSTMTRRDQEKKKYIPLIVVEQLFVIDADLVVYVCFAKNK